MNSWHLNWIQADVAGKKKQREMPISMHLSSFVLQLQKGINLTEGLFSLIKANNKALLLIRSVRIEKKLEMKIISLFWRRTWFALYKSYKQWFRFCTLLLFVANGLLLGSKCHSVVVRYLLFNVSFSLFILPRYRTQRESSGCCPLRRTARNLGRMANVGSAGIWPFKKEYVNE